LQHVVENHRKHKLAVYPGEFGVHNSEPNVAAIEPFPKHHFVGIIATYYP